MAEKTDTNAKKSPKELNQEKAASLLFDRKNLNKISLKNLLKTQEILAGAHQDKNSGKSSDVIETLISPKAQKNLDYAVLGILEQVAAGKYLSNDWETYKQQKEEILALMDASPNLKKNFPNTIAMVNRRLRPTEEQKPRVKLYHGDMKKGFVNSAIIYNNFYAADSWGKKNVIRPWRKFKRNVNKLFEPSAAAKLARLQRHNNKIKRKLWRQEKWEDAKNWVKSRPSWLNKKRKELGGKIAKWFKEKTWVGKKLVAANKWRKDTGRKIKNGIVNAGKTVWGITKQVGHGIYVGAKYAALGATAPIWGPPYIVYKGAKAGYDWTKGKYNQTKDNIKGKMNDETAKATQDRQKYVDRNPHPYEKLNDDQQKNVNNILKTYTNQARPMREDGVRKDTTKWVADDVERQAAKEMLGKLIQPKDKGGLELPPEQAKEIMDFFQKQGLMKSTYDDIAKDDNINKSVQEEHREPAHEAKVEVNDNQSKGGEEQTQPMSVEQQIEKLQLETSQQTVVSSNLKLLKQMQQNETNQEVLNTMTESYTQLFKDIGVSEEKIAQIKEMNPDLFPKKEKAQETEEATEIKQTTVKNDRGDDVNIVSGEGNIDRQPSNGESLNTNQPTAQEIELNAYKEIKDPTKEYSGGQRKTLNDLLEAYELEKKSKGEEIAETNFKLRAQGPRKRTSIKSETSYGKGHKILGGLELNEEQWNELKEYLGKSGKIPEFAPKQQRNVQNKEMNNVIINAKEKLQNS